MSVSYLNDEHTSRYAKNFFIDTIVTETRSSSKKRKVEDLPGYLRVCIIQRANETVGCNQEEKLHTQKK